MYRQQKQSLEQIAKDHNCGRKAVRTLLSNYNIPIWTKAELVMNRVPSPPNDMRQVLKTMSMSQAAVHYNVGRSTIQLWCKELGIGSDYFKYVIDKVSLQERLRTQTPLQIAESLSWPLEVVLQKIKYHKLEICSEVLPYKETCRRCASITADQWDNPGYVKTIKHGDPQLYSSVLYHTDLHSRTTDKFTERVFRLVNNFSPEMLVQCVQCASSLQFYTFKKGYGYSDKFICRSCWPKALEFPERHSQISQELFWKLYDKLSHIACWFYELNHEYRLYVTVAERSLPFVTNKQVYFIDFWCGGVAIEFDGTYWHSINGAAERDKLRTQFFTYRGIPLLRIKEEDYRNDPELVVDRCVKFIMENMTNVVAA